MKKRFIIRKYVMADSALQAIKLEKKFAIDDVFLYEEWLKKNSENGSKYVGFTSKNNKK